MDYKPQKITKELLRQVARARPPKTPREIRDSARGVVLRHQPSGYMALYAQLGRGKRERICNARDILDEHNPLTLNAALQAAKKLHGDSANGRDFTGERRSARAVPSFNEFLDDTYEPWQKENRRSGLATIMRMKSCFEAEFGKKKLSDITPAGVEKWKAGRNVKPETVNRDVGALHSALTRAVKWKIISENPLAGVEMSETDPHRRVVRALTAAEKERLVEALKARDERKRSARISANEWRKKRSRDLLPVIGGFADPLTPAVIVSLETGTRRGELLSMTWGKSVDFDERDIRVRGKTFETRDIPLNKVAFETLRAWWLQQGQPKTGYVFTIDGEQLKNLKRSYHGALAAAGIKRINAKGERVNWHSLRHTFGTLLGAALVDPTTLQKLMGHANLATTQRYLHTDEERKRDAVERLTGPA